LEKRWIMGHMGSIHERTKGLNIPGFVPLTYI
jgi:hypothetical protein